MPKSEDDAASSDTRLKVHSLADARGMVVNAIGFHGEARDHYSSEMIIKGGRRKSLELRPPVSQNGMGQFLPEQIRPRIVKTKAQLHHDAMRRLQQEQEALLRMSPSQKRQYLEKRAEQYPKENWSKPTIAKPGPALPKPIAAPKAKRIQLGRAFHQESLIKPQQGVGYVDHGVRAYFGS